jgi:hypothetical protein
MTSDPTPRPDPKPMLVGWDDGRIYLYLPGKEYCVSDDPELFQKIMDLCREYFERKSREQAESASSPNPE